MKSPNDRAIAFQLVERKISGFSLGAFYRRLAPQYCFLFVCVCLFSALSLLLPIGPFLVAIAAGVAIGVLLRDIYWMRSSRASWHLYEKVLDWNKVQRAADDQQH